MLPVIAKIVQRGAAGQGTTSFGPFRPGTRIRSVTVTGSADGAMTGVSAGLGLVVGDCPQAVADGTGTTAMDGRLTAIDFEIPIHSHFAHYYQTNGALDSHFLGGVPFVLPLNHVVRLESPYLNVFTINYDSGIVKVRIAVDAVEPVA